ncbi:8274_t:CDS:2 [Scutellospora calospora]|uniref:8274_t:CDS:1 n=1 Tax=Scutellospora calospora TaxID=85575 RepID=A0ACA9LSB9_9GLOM|nr:8274_t:CDS:2 [Scutellospora calospora]
MHNELESQVFPTEETHNSLDQQPKKRKRMAKKVQKEKRKKDQVEQNKQQTQEIQSEPILRQMVPVLFSDVEETDQDGITIMTYNLLAQSLVRREFFPESGDALKWKNRRPRLLKEILYYKPDVACFQEMDYSNYYDTFKPEFESVGYDTCFAVIGKRHDLTIEFDKVGVPTMTTNCIGLIVSLKYCETPSDELNFSNSGLIIGTTHLYWRPQSMYERARQCLILCENLMKVKEEFGFEAILAGDPTYKLMVNNTPLTVEEVSILDASMRSFGEKDIIENTDAISKNDTGLLTNSSNLPVEPISQQISSSTSVEKSTPTDLTFQPTLPKLLSNFASLPCCVSLYAQHLNSIDPENTIYSEPKFTNYGLHFKGTLDYIFHFCQNDENPNSEICDKNIKTKVKVTKLLKMPLEEELTPLPPNYKFNSDHLCLMAEVVGLV